MFKNRKLMVVIIAAIFLIASAVVLWQSGFISGIPSISGDAVSGNETGKSPGDPVAPPIVTMTCGDSNVAFEASIAVSSALDANYGGEDAVDRIFGQNGADGGEWASGGGSDGNMDGDTGGDVGGDAGDNASGNTGENKNEWIQLNWVDTKTVSKIILYDRADASINANTGKITFNDGSVITLPADCIPDDGQSGYVIDSSAFPELPKSGVKSVKFEITGGEGINVGLAEIKVIAPEISITKADDSVIVNETEIDTLMGHLDLDLPELGTVKALYESGDKTGAAQALLDYYKGRTSVWHPVDRSSKSSTYLGGLPPEMSQDIEYTLRRMFPDWVLSIDHPNKYTYLGEDINWDLNLTPVEYWDSDLNYHMYFDYLLYGYWYTADEEYVKEFITQLLDWINDCPAPTGSDGGYIYGASWNFAPWQSTFLAMIRADSWTSYFQKAIDSPLFTKGVLVKYLNSMWQHADFMRHYDGTSMPADPDHFSKGNWGIYEANGLSRIACLFPEFKDSESWRTAYKGLFIRRASNYVDPGKCDGDVYEDGMYYEESVCYSDSMNGTFVNASETIDKNGYTGFPDAYKNRICDMLRTYRVLTFPDGSGPTMADSPTSWNLRGNIYYLNKDAKYAELSDVRYILSGYTAGTVPQKTAYALPDGGYYSMRSGWDDNAICMILKSSHGGELDRFSTILDPYNQVSEGCSHNQRDNGTFELMAGGRMLTPDSGTYTYESSPGSRRFWYRRTASHQTLTVITDLAYDYGASTFCDPALQLWHPGPGLDTLVVDNQSYTDLTHRRAVHFVDKKYYVIIDEATGALTGTTDVHFHFAPGEAVYDHDALTARTNYADGWNLFVKGADNTGDMAGRAGGAGSGNENGNGISLVEEEGWISTAYEIETARPQFAFRNEKGGSNGIRFVTVLVPYEGATTPDVSIGDVIGDVGADRVVVEITVDGEMSRLGYDTSRGVSWVESGAADDTAAGTADGAADSGTDGAAYNPELLYNTGFERGTAYWVPYNGNEKLTVVSGPDMADDARSMKVSGRQDADSSLAQDITQVLIDNGPGSYRISASVKLQNGSDAVLPGITLTTDPEAKTYSYFNIPAANVNSEEFIQISGTIDVTWDGTLKQALLYIPTTSVTCDIYLDNISLKKE